MTPEPEPKARQYRAAGKLRGRAAIITGGYTGAKTLQHISWEEFFTKFDESDLVFLYQEKTRDGRTSRFRKFVGRRSAQDRESGR